MDKALCARGLLAVLLLAAGCASADERTPTETDDATAAAKAALPSGPAAPVQTSSLCAAYEWRQAEHRAALARSPHDQVLQQNVATFETVHADACP